MPIELSTAHAPAHRKLAFWQDIVCDTFVQLDCRSELGDDLHGTLSSSMLGQMSCTEVTSSAQRVYRTPSRIARAREDYILIALGREGVGGVVQDGREVVIHPGAFAFYDTTRPYELLFDADFHQTIFQIPRAELQGRVAGTETLTAVGFDRLRPLDRLALDFLTSISGLVDQVDADTGTRLSEQALDLVAMAIGDRLAHRPVSPSSHRAALLHRLKAHIRAHLADPELSVADTAAALGISSRYVNNLLADEQTSFQRHVLAQRLEQCHRALASPAQVHRQIGEIAFAWGFNDLSHFGRAFREHYGLSPRAWRASRSGS
ncbi:helix-turn-helix domain-containing protein [Bradyrhizobium sp. 2TAF24]|uniref:AraC-like ligand-binding domain-containing protein n=1 Tax=Bradyrhizobium sp. 2TAF24 TaxID=3233011 RepID=UPI003F90EABB